MEVLEAADCSVTIDHEHGARLASLVVHGHELLVGADEGLPGPTGWGSFPMVPWAGRIRDARFRHAGAEVALPARLPPHALHGTVLDRPWTQTGPGRARCDLGPEWPWAGHVEQQVELTARSLSLVLEVHAHDEPMPVAVGWHPWFRRRIAGVEVVLDVPASAMWRRDDAGVATDELVEPTPGPWDDCFTGLIGPVTLTWPGVLLVAVDGDGEHVVVYDEQDVGVGVEPQTAPPDAHNTGVDLTIVRPDEPLVTTSTWVWQVPPPT